MSEGILSEFIEELNRRRDPAPRDLIEKYTKLGLAPSEMAAAAMARAALLGTEVPESAFERSVGRIGEMSGRAAMERQAVAGGPSLVKRILIVFRRLLNLKP